MEHIPVQKDTAAWIFQTWTAFIVSVAFLAIGIVSLPVNEWMRGFLGLGLFFSISSSFTLAKTLRDNHEAGKLINRLSEAKTEKYLSDYELK